MKIEDSAIQLNSQHTSLQKNVKNESLTVWGARKNPQTVTNNSDTNIGPEALRQEVIHQASVKVSLSTESKKMTSGRVQAYPLSSGNIGNSVLQLNLLILQAMIERLTGRVVQTADLNSIVANGNSPSGEGAEAGGQPPPSGENQVQNSGFGLVYEYHQSHIESETTNFAAQGKIVTQDGQEIDFSSQLTMSRETSSSVDQTIRMGEALKDPLVINFNGTAAQLTQTHYSFDLMTDGRPQNIAFVAPGSGFLALDKNGNNTIDNGSELFGPATGNGFNELATYDRDGNGWIDENDPVFKQLLVWTKDANGQDMLSSLSQTGVGALYLGNVATPFSLENGASDPSGQVRSTGIFVREDGSVGTLQQVDLVA